MILLFIFGFDGDAVGWTRGRVEYVGDIVCLVIFLVHESMVVMVAWSVGCFYFWVLDGDRIFVFEDVVEEVVRGHVQVSYDLGYVGFLEKIQFWLVDFVCHVVFLVNYVKDHVGG